MSSLKPVATVGLVIALMLGLAEVPGTAHAAGMNTLNRFCNKSSRTTSCTVDPGSADDLARSRSITFRDGSGVAHTYRSASGVWSFARHHSTSCIQRGDVHGCFYADPIAGRAIVLHDGVAIAVDKFFRR